MSDDKQPEPEPPKQDAPEEDDKLSDEPEGNIEKMVERGHSMEIRSRPSLRLFVR